MPKSMLAQGKQNFGQGRAGPCNGFVNTSCVDSTVQPNLSSIDSEDTVALLFSPLYMDNSSLGYF